MNVRCKATINDTNGRADISAVNASIFRSGISPTASPDNNYKYDNSSCEMVYAVNNLAAYYSCNFQVWFYTYNDTWTCNMTALDSGGLRNSSDANKDIDSLIALNLNTAEIDFGELEPTQESASDEIVNVTNYGNRNITLNLKGYGVTEGDSWAMNCTVGNISIGNERYHASPGQSWSSMTPLTNNFAQVAGLSVDVRKNDADTDNSETTYETYWKIKAPTGTRGVCNGSVVFSAEQN